MLIAFYILYKNIIVMEINLNLKNVKKISYELYDGSKIELNDDSYIKENTYQEKCASQDKTYEKKQNTLEAYKDSIYEDLTNRIKDKFSTIMDKADELDKIAHNSHKNKDLKSYYKSI